MMREYLKQSLIGRRAWAIVNGEVINGKIVKGLYLGATQLFIDHDYANSSSIAFDRAFGLHWGLLPIPTS